MIEQNQEAFPKEISEFFIFGHEKSRLSEQSQLSTNFGQPSTPIPTFHGLRTEKGSRPTEPAADTAFSITACPLGHLCTKEAKCPPAGRTGGPPYWPDEGDTPEKIHG